MQLSDFSQLWKTDLHFHLDGSMRLSTVCQIINQQKLVLEPMWTLQDIESGKINEAFMDPLFFQDPIDIEKYWKAFDITILCLQTKANVRRAVEELLQDCIEQNIKHIDIRYAPCFHTKGDFKTQLEAQLFLDETLFELKQKYQVSASIIMCAMNIYQPSDPRVLETVELFDPKVAKQYKNHVLYDQAGPEVDLVPFTDILNHIKSYGVDVSMHAAMFLGPINGQQAIEIANCKRIGHGLQIMASEEVMKLCKSNKVCLELCFTAETVITIPEVGTNVENFPIKLFLSNGVRCTLATDDKLMNHTNISEEYFRVYKSLKLNPLSVLLLLQLGFKSVLSGNEVERSKLEKQALEHNVQVLERFQPDIFARYSEVIRTFE